MYKATLWIIWHCTPQLSILKKCNLWNIFIFFNFFERFYCCYYCCCFSTERKWSKYTPKYFVDALLLLSILLFFIWFILQMTEKISRYSLKNISRYQCCNLFSDWNEDIACCLFRLITIVTAKIRQLMIGKGRFMGKEKQDRRIELWECSKSSSKIVLGAVLMPFIALIDILYFIFCDKLNSFLIGLC